MYVVYFVMNMHDTTSWYVEVCAQHLKSELTCSTSSMYLGERKLAIPPFNMSHPDLYKGPFLGIEIRHEYSAEVHATTSNLSVSPACYQCMSEMVCSMELWTLENLSSQKFDQPYRANGTSGTIWTLRRLSRQLLTE